MVQALQTLVVQLVLTAAPHGGQRASRRNAWVAMVDDHGITVQHRQVAAVLTGARVAAATRGPVRLAEG